MSQFLSSINDGMLDINTAATLLIFSSFTSMVIIFLFSIQNNHPACLIHWSLGSLASAIGIVLVIILRTKVPTFFSIFIGNLFVILGYFFYYSGLKKFTFEEENLGIFWIIFIIFCIPFLIYHNDPGAVGIRIFANALALTTFSSLIIIHLVSQQYIQKLGGIIFSITFFGTTIISLIRIKDNFQVLVRDDLVSNPLLSDVLIFGWATLSYIIFTAGAIILYTNKINNNLKLQNSSNQITNDALSQTIRNQKKFLGVIAHEFLTPLSSISASNLLLKQKNSKNVENIEEIDRIDRSVKKLTQLTDEVLLDANTANFVENLELKPINVHPLLAEICNEFQINYKFNLDVNTKILGQDKYFSLLLSNLITNALKFSFNKKNIKIICDEEKNYLIIKIMNDGEPMTKELIHKFNDSKELEPIKSSKRISFGLFFIRDLVNKFQGMVNYKYEKKTNIFIIKLSKYQK